MKPLWVSFYSYKGGVGRSMALANLATLLARKGRRVFMIDFDLEAPGLDSFHQFGVEGKQMGVVEYAHEFLKTKIAPDLEPFVQECKFPKPIRGKVWLMQSGKKDEAYNAKRTTLNWEELYALGLGEPFVANWKAAIHRLYKPDYVFVDSRTGLTDVGGICTLHLPDLVVLLFGLNEQNTYGIAAVLQTIRNAPTPRPPQILTVATPVPNLPRNDDGLLKTRFAEAEKLLGIKIESTISYNPEAALIEKLFTLDSDSGQKRICAEYADLLEAIEKRDENGLDSLIRKANQARECDDDVTAVEVRQALLDDFSDRSDALFNVGQIDRFLGRRDEAIEWWHKAFQQDPTHESAFAALINHYNLRNQLEEALKLYDEKLSRAEELDPATLYNLHFEKAERLMVLGRYSEAVDCYAASLDDKKGEQKVSLPSLFNLSEAKRRSQSNPDLVLCKKIVDRWAEEVALETEPLSSQANQLQAMHIPYACIGKFSIARDLLDRARRCAMAVGKAEKIFCVKTYTWLSVEEFLDINADMTLALDSSQLWDHTPISKAE